ncbi:hypothetical protein BRYFOR_06121 [Marvinbryantia formatexigens DSM 14469]|uniref:Uncharacterized protein n=1 Tax=Marvinbryantia formatexigens DSM 14469 TaxID=478749 RepID=C6LBX6_9FIRM|nr:hypothetical protein BRYFOR_06121 [Marvinbryantia formatexigens DSM 14469]
MTIIRRPSVSTKRDIRRPEHWSKKRYWVSVAPEQKEISGVRRAERGNNSPEG